MKKNQIRNDSFVVCSHDDNGTHCPNIVATHGPASEGWLLLFVAIVLKSIPTSIAYATWSVAGTIVVAPVWYHASSLARKPANKSVQFDYTIFFPCLYKHHRCRNPKVSLRVTRRGVHSVRISDVSSRETEQVRNRPANHARIPLFDNTEQNNAQPLLPGQSNRVEGASDTPGFVEPKQVQGNG